MWVFDAEGQNNTHLGCDLSRMMGCLFCSFIGLSHLFLSSVLLMPLSPFCLVPLICSVIIFHFHVTVTTPLSYFITFVYLSSLPSLPNFFICHLIVNLLLLPTLPIFMLPNLCSFILLFLLTFIPFSHS